MSFPNSNYSDIITTSIESRTREIADNVTNNNALLKRLEEKDNIQLVDGGHKIIQELAFAENANGTWYDGYEPIQVSPQDVISAAEFAWKQYATSVAVSGKEMRMNSGRARQIDLVANRLKVAVNSMKNAIAQGLYSDGTGSGGKTLTGLAAAVSATPTTGTYGGIDRSVAGNAFWRNYFLDTNAAPAAASIQGHFNTAWSNLVRGSDRPDLIVVDGDVWSAYLASLQSLQRFTEASEGKLGFPTLKYQTADVVLDGGIGGYADDVTALFLNTSYLHYRPHKDMNMRALDPEGRYATNQDAVVKLLGFMGNLTCSGAKFQGRILFS